MWFVISLLPRLAPKAERLMDRTIAETEQVRVRCCMDAQLIPGRNDEDVIGTKAVRGPVDFGVTGTLQTDVDGTVRAPVRLGLETSGKPLRIGSDCRHRRSAGGRVHITQLEAKV